uniref:dUTP diphosphatase n=1 Tax=Aegilops tauschii subsp. strangulata TaxID=200361 RepID=A0A453LXV4_AEGTS
MVNINYARIRGRRGAGLLHVSGECLPWIQQEGDPAFFMSRATRVIDADYHSPVGVVLFNHSEADFAVKPGDCVV